MIDCTFSRRLWRRKFLVALWLRFMIGEITPYFGRSVNTSHSVGLRAARDGAVVKALASHQCGPGSNPAVDVIFGLSLMLVLSFVPRDFSPGTSVFPSLQNSTFPISRISPKKRRREKPLRGCASS